MAGGTAGGVVAGLVGLVRGWREVGVCDPPEVDPV